MNQNSHEKPPESALSIYVRSIDECLGTMDAYTAQALLQQYRTSADKDSFVAALVARLLVAVARQQTGSAA